ncbi:MAG TPA: helix-turn-helix transcriptional regulator [Solirubrobacterales bacterium]|nr:helix-turn-helix transcriptional regulator [Solirubrobacterales bacterium]
MSTQGPKSHLAATVKLLRDKADLTQEELAHRAGLHTTWVSHIESGRVNPKWETVERIAWGLEVPLQQLAALAERPKPEDPLAAETASKP